MITVAGRVLLIVFALFTVSCVSTTTRTRPAPKVIHTTISPKDIYEECMKAMPGQKIIYSFKASLPMDFNIHYHVAGKVHYAVYEPGVSHKDAGTYNVETEGYYCLMWTNTAATGVQLSYSYKVKD
jgi:hypothetical protein